MQKRRMSENTATGGLSRAAKRNKRKKKKREGAGKASKSSGIELLTPEDLFPLYWKQLEDAKDLNVGIRFCFSLIYCLKRFLIPSWSCFVLMGSIAVYLQGSNLFLIRWHFI